MSLADCILRIRSEVDDAILAPGATVRVAVSARVFDALLLSRQDVAVRDASGTGPSGNGPHIVATLGEPGEPGVDVEPASEMDDNEVQVVNGDVRLHGGRLARTGPELAELEESLQEVDWFNWFTEALGRPSEEEKAFFAHRRRLGLGVGLDAEGELVMGVTERLADRVTLHSYRVGDHGQLHDIYLDGELVPGMQMRLSGEMTGRMMRLHAARRLIDCNIPIPALAGVTYIRVDDGSGLMDRDVLDLLQDDTEPSSRT